MRYQISQLETLATLIRLEIFKLWGNTHGPLSGALSIVDVYVVLFFRIFSGSYWTGSKRLARVIPKSTGALALYATLKYAGLLNEESKKHFPPVVRKDGWIGGVSSTLTKNLDQGIGMALVSKFSGENYPVIVFISEGDLQSGVDQQAKIASLWGLNNLIAIVDCNRVQSNYFVASVDPTVIPDSNNSFPRLRKIWEGYGGDYREVDGHDYRKLENIMRDISKAEKPLIIIARTIKGRGVPFIEKNPIKYVHKIPPGDIKRAMNYLYDRIEKLNAESVLPKEPLTPVHFRSPDINRPPLVLPRRDKKDNSLSPRELFKDWLTDFCELNHGRVFVIDTDNPYPFESPIATFSRYRKSSRIFVGVNEKMAVNIARGIANAGCFPIFASPATHLQASAEDFMRCAIDKDCVLLVGFWPGSDLAHWGLTHNSNRDCLLFSFPDASVFQSATSVDVRLILDGIYQNPQTYLPAYLRLSAEKFDPAKLGFVNSDIAKAFQDGFYYFYRTKRELISPRVLFVASGSTLRECAESILLLEKKGIPCLLVNILNLRYLSNSILLNKTASGADIIISVIDADPVSLYGILFETLALEQRRKVIMRGLKDFSRGLYSKEEIFRHNQMDAKSLVKLVFENLSKSTMHRL